MCVYIHTHNKTFTTCVYLHYICIGTEVLYLLSNKSGLSILASSCRLKALPGNQTSAYQHLRHNLNKMSHSCRQKQVSLSIFNLLNLHERWKKKSHSRPWTINFAIGSPVCSHSTFMVSPFPLNTIILKPTFIQFLLRICLLYNSWEFWVCTGGSVSNKPHFAVMIMVQGWVPSATER